MMESKRVRVRRPEQREEEKIELLGSADSDGQMASQAVGMGKESRRALWVLLWEFESLPLSASASSKESRVSVGVEIPFSLSLLSAQFRCHVA